MSPLQFASVSPLIYNSVFIASVPPYVSVPSYFRAPPYINSPLYQCVMCHSVCLALELPRISVPPLHQQIPTLHKFPSPLAQCVLLYINVPPLHQFAPLPHQGALLTSVYPSPPLHQCAPLQHGFSSTGGTPLLGSAVVATGACLQSSCSAQGICYLQGTFPYLVLCAHDLVFPLTLWGPWGQTIDAETGGGGGTRVFPSTA